MKDLKPRKGAAYLQRLIAEGEHEHQDFKYSVSDARKIARSVSAFANNSGGRLLIGVKDNGVIAGVRNEEDLYVVETAAAIYCRPPQDVAFTAYRAEGGEVVFVAEIAESAAKPVMVAESDGSLRAYYRVNDENIAASPLMVESWNRQRQPSDGPLRLTPAETLLLRRIADGSTPPSTIHAPGPLLPPQRHGVRIPPARHRSHHPPPRRPPMAPRPSPIHPLSPQQPPPSFPKRPQAS